MRREREIEKEREKEREREREREREKKRERESERGERGSGNRAIGVRLGPSPRTVLHPSGFRVGLRPRPK